MALHIFSHGLVEGISAMVGLFGSGSPSGCVRATPSSPPVNSGVIGDGSPLLPPFFFATPTPAPPQVFTIFSISTIPNPHVVPYLLPTNPYLLLIPFFSSHQIGTVLTRSFGEGWLRRVWTQFDVRVCARPSAPHLDQDSHRM